jgi:hypothetical protein
MVALKELDQFIKEYGKDGMRFLMLFCLLKSKAKFALRQCPDLSEERLNRACMAKAEELLRLGKDQPTEKDIEELLLHIR